MSLEKFITDMLNVELDELDSITSIPQSDDSIVIKLKLCKKENVSCPICHGKVKTHGYYSRKLLHSTLVNRKCTIVYQQRRYICDPCEFTFHEDNPFTSSSNGCTYETTINVLKELKHTNSTYSSTAKRFHLSPTKVQRIFDQHVDIPRKTLPEVLSVDEHYFPNSDQDGLYIFVLMDFCTGTLIDVLPDRKKDCLISYFSNIKNKTFDHKTGLSELNNVKYISIDLTDNYRDIAKAYFPKAIICADSFHVLKHLTDDFRKIRTRCRRNTQDETLVYLLTKFKYIFNFGIDLDNTPRYNKHFKRYMNYRDIISIIFNNFPELERAYELKNQYILFNRTADYKNAKEDLSDLIRKFGESNIKEYEEFYNLLINWNQEIINSFIKVKSKRINNSYIESRNAKIERLIMNAYGFTNFKRTRNRILYCINKDDNYRI